MTTLTLPRPRSLALADSDLAEVHRLTRGLAAWDGRQLIVGPQAADLPEGTENGRVRAAAALADVIRRLQDARLALLAGDPDWQVVLVGGDGSREEVYRGHGAEEAQAFADEWNSRGNEELATVVPPMKAAA